MASNPSPVATRATTLFLGNAADAAAAWESIRALLRAEFGTRTFDSWLKPVEFVGIDGHEVTLALPTHFMCDWIKNHFFDRLRGLWMAQVPQVRSIRLIVSPTIRGAERPAAADGEAQPEFQMPETASVSNTAAAIGVALEERYNFDSFVVGKSNELAYNAARTLAEGGPLTFNPLFLHGTTGLGKTHLMHAIGWEVRARNPRAQVAYMSAEKFMVEFLGALRNKDTIAFKQRLRSVDLLMIDDVQFIAGKDSTQEEFFHTMNEIITAGRRLVITSDRAPQDLDGIAPRILSRLSWGLVADINAADFELRFNIIETKLAALPAVDMPRNVVEFLARRVTSSIRELEGALNRIAAYAMMTGRAIDVAFVEEVLANVLRANQRRITIDEIQAQVAEHYRIRKAEMTSARRAREVARPRQVAMYLSKQLTPKSLPDIGRRFGGRDHTTVIHAVRQIEKLRASDAELDADIRLLTRQLEG